MDSIPKPIIRLLFIYFLTSLTCFSQIKIDPIKKEKFDSALNVYKIDMSNTDFLGKKMMANAQTDYEKSVAYNVLGESQIDVSNYVKSVDYLEKSIYHIKKTDSIDLYLRVLGTLIVAYRQAGLVNDSDSNWKLFQKEIKKIPEEDQNVSLLFIRARMYDIDKNYCKSAETREKFNNLFKHRAGDNEIGYSFNFAIVVQIVYDQFKCGNIEASQKTMIEAESILAKMKQRDNIFMYEFYLLDKALFFVHNKQNNLAKKTFDQAYNLSLKVKSGNIQKVILEERLNANIDSAEEKLKIYEALEILTKKEIKATKTITEIETKKNKEKLKTISDNNRNYLMFFGIISLCLVLFMVYYYQRNKKQKAQFLKIIKELEQSVEDKTLKEDVYLSEKLIKSDETEKKLVEKLNSFEKKQLFNTKGISVAQMAVMLKTNTKYLSYILKEYRNADFYTYINNCRINFIVKELHDNPSLLNYKIAVLSDMCGYNSHSQFASIFKSIKEISPSQYISFLRQERKGK